MKRFHILLVVLTFLALGGFFSYFHVEIDEESSLKLQRGVIRTFDYQPKEKMLRIQLEGKKTVFHGRYFHHRRDQIRLLKKGDLVNIWSQTRKGFPMSYFSSESRLIMKLQHQNLMVLTHAESAVLAKNKVKTANWVGWGMIATGLLFSILLFKPDWVATIRKYTEKRSDLTSKE